MSVPVAPSDPTPAWSAFVGPGNPAPGVVSKKCGRGKVRGKNGGCVRKRRRARKHGARRAALRAAGRGRGGAR